MSDWAGFWIGLGIACGFGVIGLGLQQIGENAYAAIDRWIRHIERNDPIEDDHPRTV